MSAKISLGMGRNAQRLIYAAVICTLLLHTLVCTCMPMHWLHDALHPLLEPSSVSAEQWVQNITSHQTHAASHYSAIVTIDGPNTGAHVSDPDPALNGFGQFLILVAVTPSLFLRLGKLIVADQFGELPYPLDQTPIRGVPVMPPRSSL